MNYTNRTIPHGPLGGIVTTDSSSWKLPDPAPLVKALRHTRDLPLRGAVPFAQLLQPRHETKKMPVVGIHLRPRSPLQRSTSCVKGLK